MLPRIRSTRLAVSGKTGGCATRFSRPTANRTVPRKNATATTHAKVTNREARISLLLESPEDRHRVLAAEAEAVDHRGVDFRLALDVGHVVEVALGVRLMVVDGRGDPTVADGADGGDRGQGPGRAERVPDHRLG